MNTTIRAFIFSALMASSQAQADTATCQCQLGIEPGNGTVTLMDIPGVDLTTKANLKFNGRFVFTPGNQRRCRDRCERIFDEDVGIIATAMCAKYKNSVRDIPKRRLKLYWNLGGQMQRYIKDVGLLFYQAPYQDRRYTCPPDWQANETNIFGGTTTQGICKKEGGPVVIAPPPPDGTPIGNWGFVWGGKAIAYGTAANGGAPLVKILVDVAEQCKFE